MKVSITKNNKTVDIELTPEQEALLEGEKEEFEDGDEYYYYMTGGGDISPYILRCSDLDNALAKTGNAFHTRAELKKKRDWLKAVAKVNKYITDRGIGRKFVEDEKHWITSWRIGRWFSDWFITLPVPMPFPYLISKQACDQLIADCEKELDILQEGFWV